MSAITVSAGFAADFKFFCARVGYDRLEEQTLREEVRADFNRVGAWVSETVSVYRFCDETWGGLPTPELCEGYLASQHWWPQDPSIFMRLGILAQARLCWRVSTQ